MIVRLTKSNSLKQKPIQLYSR